ncbi:MAG: hypothetical protein RL120_01650 [Gammaproteobacteria bacterium]
MEMSALNDWLSLAANLGVIAGIVFLAIELRQNNELLRSESRRALLSNDQASIIQCLANYDIFAKINQQEKLSQDDQLRLSMIYALDLRNREFEFFQFKNGLLDEDTWKSYRDILIWNHSTPRGRVWWNKLGRSMVNAEFSVMADKLLQGVEVSSVNEDLGNWDEEIRHQE